MSKMPPKHADTRRRQKIRNMLSVSPPPQSLLPAPRAPQRLPLIQPRSATKSHTSIPSALEFFTRRRVDPSLSNSHHEHISAGINKPRKRFRRKVSSIFADNTDLKKRVEKLFINASVDDILTLASMPSKNRPPTARKESCILKLPDKALQALAAIAKSDEAVASRLRLSKHPGFIRNGSKIWGEKKMQRMRHHVDSREPIGNNAFMRVLGIGEGKENVTNAVASDVANVVGKAPKRLSVNWFVEDAKHNAMTHRKPVDRFGLPAVLRKNAKRNERGYRIDGGPRTLGVRAVKRFRRPLQRRVSPRTTDAFEMLVEVAAEQQKDSQKCKQGKENEIETRKDKEYSSSKRRKIGCDQ